MKETTKNLIYNLQCIFAEKLTLDPVFIFPRNGKLIIEIDIKQTYNLKEFEEILTRMLDDVKELKTRNDFE